MIVTIDGPAGAGKSSVARALAQRLGFVFLDTGAMYRAVAWAALQRDVDLRDTDALAELITQLEIDLEGTRVRLDGVDVTESIRTPEVTDAVRFVADSLPVRLHLSALQRRVAEQGSIVTEGRDQGTMVFPQAECKIFLTASPAERARRRCREMRANGLQVTEQEVLRQQTDRDRHDGNREIGRLVKAPDALEFCTDGLEVNQVVDQLESLIRQHLPAGESS